MLRDLYSRYYSDIGVVVSLEYRLVIIFHEMGITVIRPANGLKTREMRARLRVVIGQTKSDEFINVKRDISVIMVLEF